MNVLAGTVVGVLLLANVASVLADRRRRKKPAFSDAPTPSEALSDVLPCRQHPTATQH